MAQIQSLPQTPIHRRQIGYTVIFEPPEPERFRLHLQLPLHGHLLLHHTFDLMSYSLLGFLLHILHLNHAAITSHPTLLSSLGKPPIRSFIHRRHRRHHPIHLLSQQQLIRQQTRPSSSSFFPSMGRGGEAHHMPLPLLTIRYTRENPGVHVNTCFSPCCRWEGADAALQ